MVKKIIFLLSLVFSISLQGASLFDRKEQKKVYNFVNYEKLFLKEKISIKLTPFLVYTRIESRANNQTEAFSLSKLGYGVNLNSSYKKSKKISFLFSAQYFSNRYTVSPNKTLAKTNSYFFQTDIGIRKTLSSFLEGDLKIGYEKSPILRAINFSTLKFDSTQNPYISLSLHSHLIKKEFNTLSLTLPFKYSFQGETENFKTKGGIGYGASLNYHYKKQKQGFSTGLSYFEQNNKFLNAKTKSKILMLSFWIYF